MSVIIGSFKALEMRKINQREFITTMENAVYKLLLLIRGTGWYPKGPYDHWHWDLGRINKGTSVVSRDSNVAFSLVFSASYQWPHYQTSVNLFSVAMNGVN